MKIPSNDSSHFCLPSFEKEVCNVMVVCFSPSAIHSESEDGEVWYYSTTVQLEELLEAIDGENMEVALAREIGDFKDEIMRQMELTEKLTNQNKGNKKSYLDVENGELFLNLISL
jgi:hypothetical protein